MSLVRTGRVLVYTNQVPYETDILRTNMYRMADVSCLAQAVLGYGISNGTLVSGLACTPTSPASLSVNIGPGTIYQYVEYDPQAYGVIPADTTDMLYKQGINLTTTNLSMLAPGSSGTNYYLVQAQFNTNYTVNPVSRPYYNSANPQSPIFTTNPDTVQDTVTLQTLVSTVSTPTPTSGWVGLWAVNVAFGQTTITSGNISVYSGAPFISETLTQKISTTSGDLRYVKLSQTPFNQINVIKITSSQTYTPSAGLVQAKVTLGGAGAGGGGCAGCDSSHTAVAGSGGAGATAIKTYTAAQIGASAAVVIGTKGTGGAAGANPGLNGNNSSFTPTGTGSAITANGGIAGIAGLQTTSFLAFQGGGGGTASGGDENINGDGGSISVAGSSNATSSGNGGGNAVLRGGGAGPSGTGAGNNAATNSGGGGSGASVANSGSAAAGGNGADGYCIIEEYIWNPAA